MNAARLSRKWTEAKGDPSLMEALADEIDDPAAGLVSREHLDMRVAELQGQIDRRFAELQGLMDRRFAEAQAASERRFGEQSMALTWRMLGIAGGQVVVLGALIQLFG